MSAYQPPEKSFSQKLSENLFVQLSLVILIGIIAVMMITRNQKQSFWSRVQFLRGSISTQVQSSGDASQFTSSYSQQVEVAPEIQNSDIAKDLDVVAATKNSKSITTPQARIYYIEIPQTTLNKWLEDGILTRVETSEGVTIGYIPQLAQAMEQYKSQIKVIKEESFNYTLNQLYTAKLEAPKSEQNPSTTNGRVVASTAENSFSNQPISGAPGSSAPSTQSQLMAYATLDDDRNDTLSGQLEVSVNPQASFPAQFEMTSDQSFFISGFERQNRAAGSETIVIFKIDK